MEISIYFEPVNSEKIQFNSGNSRNCIGHQIVHIDESSTDEQLNEFDAVLVGINEDRNSINNQGCANAPDEIRKYLYQLSSGKNKLKIGDLGNIRSGEQLSDTYFAIKSTVLRLLNTNAKLVILGGSQDLTFPVYLGYEEAGKIINLVSVDARFDNDKADDSINARSYLSKIIYRKPNFLFNFANIGYQTYFVDQNDIKLLDDLYFDAFRLGVVRQDIEETEPVIRNADFLSFDISSVRHSDAPGNYNSSPNGFYGEEVCQLIRYAGLSSKLTSIGFFETNPLFDPLGQTSHLVAQMVWYFLDGLSGRINDYPDKNADDFIKYIVTTKGIDNDLIFYKSKITDRWWMQLPISREKEKHLYRHIMVPCSYNDYLKACNSEIPDRWWKAYQKLM